MAVSDNGPHSIRTALIVEDDSMQSVVVEMLLQDYGIPSVLTAADADAAVALAQQHRIDLLICDLTLPGRNGMSLLREIGEQPHRPAVVVLSGVDGSLLNAVGNVVAGMKIHFLGALAKPLRIETLDALLCRSGNAVSLAEPAAAPWIKPPDALLLLGLRQGWYQPYYEARVSCRTGRVAGVEILARLCLPGGNVVRPAAFITELESAGKIAEMTWLVAERGFEFVGQLRRQGLLEHVSLNLSPLMLDDESLPDRLHALAQRSGLPADAVVLEITEAAAINTREAWLERLVHLRLRGFGLSIDDFGTGFSTLAQLSKVPFTEMKIDRLFTADAPTDPKARALVETSIDLARRLGIRVCAEGVETQSVLDQVRALGVDAMQGYLFHQPMPADDFLRWLSHWNASVSCETVPGSAAAPQPNPAG